jgi:hypothetical protein
MQIISMCCGSAVFWPYIQTGTRKSRQRRTVADTSGRLLSSPVRGDFPWQPMRQVRGRKVKGSQPYQTSDDGPIRRGRGPRDTHTAMALTSFKAPMVAVGRGGCS